MSQQPRILVVGDVMLDRYIHGVVERISPEAPIPILRQTHIEDRPGGAANVAANLASLGAAVTLVGAIGADQDGGILSSMCGSLVRRYLTLNAPLGLTEVKHRYVCAGQQMLRVDQDGGRPTGRARADIDQAVYGLLNTASALVLSDYAGGVLDAPQGMIARAKSHSVPVYVDPKGPDWSRYCGATLIKPNEAELRAVVGDWEDGPDMVDRARRHLRLSGIEYALVTMGAGGMTLIDSGCTHWHQPATSGPVVDVTGAGDTVLACVAYLRSQGMDWPDVLRFAAMGAAAVCARHGTSAVTLADIDMVADDVC